jgi:hypothetical protein
MAAGTSGFSSLGSCPDDTSRFLDRALAAAQTALADVPAPSCTLGSVTIDGDTYREETTLEQLVRACGALRSLVLDDCGKFHPYPAVTLRVGADGRVTDVAVDTSLPVGGACVDAGSTNGPDGSADPDAGARDAAPSPDASDAAPSGAEIAACISSALTGRSFVCHAGAKLCAVTQYVVGPPI